MVIPRAFQSATAVALLAAHLGGVPPATSWEAHTAPIEEQQRIPASSVGVPQAPGSSTETSAAEPKEEQTPQAPQQPQKQKKRKSKNALKQILILAGVLGGLLLVGIYSASQTR